MLSVARVLFPNCTLTCRANNYVSRQGNDISKRIENTRRTIVNSKIVIKICRFVLFPTVVFDSQEVAFLPRKYNSVSIAG